MKQLNFCMYNKSYEDETAKLVYVEKYPARKKELKKDKN